MTKPEAANRLDELAGVPWRKSSFSGDQGACVEAAALDDGCIVVRNSNHPEAGVIHFTRTEMDAWIRGVKAGEFDDLGVVR